MSDTKNTSHQIGFPIPEALYNKSVSFVQASEQAEDARKYAQELIDIINQMTDIGLEFFFIDSLKEAKIGMISQNAIKMGMSAAKRTVLSVAAKIIKGMSHDQMRSVTGYVRKILENSNKISF